MSSDLKKQAQELATQQYSMFVFRDMTTDDEPVYIALNPELEGCFAQGETSQEAQENLNAFRVDYIHHLLVHHLPVPEPSWKSAETEDANLPQLYMTSPEGETEQPSQESVRVTQYAVD